MSDDACVTMQPKTEMMFYMIESRRVRWILPVPLLHTTMVNCRISPDRKLCALNLWDHGWEIEDICFAMMISRSSLYRWRRIFAEQVIVTVIDHADEYSNAHELQGQPKITKGSTLD